jgi:hypothetical protein
MAPFRQFEDDLRLVVLGGNEMPYHRRLSKQSFHFVLDLLIAV